MYTGLNTTITELQNTTLLTQGTIYGLTNGSEIGFTTPLGNTTGANYTSTYFENTDSITNTTSTGTVLASRTETTSMNYQEVNVPYVNFRGAFATILMLIGMYGIVHYGMNLVKMR